MTNQIDIAETKGSATDASKVFVGDFRQLLIGVRTESRVLVSQSGHDPDAASTINAFKNLQLLVRVHARIDIALARANHFCMIDGYIA